jgi:hypothetical protein
MTFNVISIDRSKAVLESEPIGKNTLRMELLGNPTGMGRNGQMVILTCLRDGATVSTEEISMAQFMEYGGDAAWVALHNMSILMLVGDRNAQISYNVADWLLWASGETLTDGLVSFLEVRPVLTKEATDKQSKWNEACDMAINKSLERVGFKMPQEWADWAKANDPASRPEE